MNTKLPDALKSAECVIKLREQALDEARHVIALRKNESIESAYHQLTELEHSFRMRVHARTMLCALLGIAPKSVGLVPEFNRDSMWLDRSSGLVEFLTPVYAAVAFDKLWPSMWQLDCCEHLGQFYLTNIREQLRRYLGTDVTD